MTEPAVPTTGAEALARLKALHAACLTLRELLAAQHPDLNKVQAQANAIDAALAALPPPSALTAVDEACANALRDEAKAIAAIHRIATYGLTRLRSRYAPATATFRASDRMKAYSETTELNPSLGRFIDQRH